MECYGWQCYAGNKFILHVQWYDHQFLYSAFQATPQTVGVNLPAFSVIRGDIGFVAVQLELDQIPQS